MCVHRKVRFSSSELISPLAQPGVVCKRGPLAIAGWAISSRSTAAACHHVALLTPEALLRAGLSPATKVLDLKGAAAVPRVRAEEASGRLDQVAGAGPVSVPCSMPIAFRCRRVS
jgi:hypothetical protein